MKKRKHVTENPATEIVQRMNRANKKKIMRPVLSIQDVIRIIRASTNPGDRAIMLMFYKTGMRVHGKSRVNWRREPTSSNWNSQILSIGDLLYV
jgi:site-specific recombinase XerD